MIQCMLCFIVCCYCCCQLYSSSVSSSSSSRRRRNSNIIQEFIKKIIPFQYHDHNDYDYKIHDSEQREKNNKNELSLLHDKISILSDEIKQLKNKSNTNKLNAIISKRDNNKLKLTYDNQIEEMKSNHQNDLTNIDAKHNKKLKQYEEIILNNQLAYNKNIEEMKSNHQKDLTNIDAKHNKVLKQYEEIILNSQQQQQLQLKNKDNIIKTLTNQHHVELNELRQQYKNLSINSNKLKSMYENNIERMKVTHQRNVTNIDAKYNRKLKQYEELLINVDAIVKTVTEQHKNELNGLKQQYNNLSINNTNNLILIDKLKKQYNEKSNECINLVDDSKKLDELNKKVRMVIFLMMMMIMMMMMMIVSWVIVMMMKKKMIMMMKIIL